MPGVSWLGLMWIIHMFVQACFFMANGGIFKRSEGCRWVERLQNLGNDLGGNSSKESGGKPASAGRVVAVVMLPLQ